MEFSDHVQRWKAHRASWVERPQDWVWQAPERLRQGFGPMVRDGAAGVGLANLLWLSMDMETPPRFYDARTNPLYVALALYAPQMVLNAWPLLDQAADLTLRQFHEQCNKGPLLGPKQLGTMLPLIQLLATRRLENALT